MNGYFQIQTNERGVSLLLSPPVGEGEKIRAAEIKEYLNSIGVPYDVKAINSALSSMGEEEIVLFLAPIKIPPVNEKCDIQVMLDKMTVIMRMYPPSAGGRPTSKAHIMDLLGQSKVRAGIDETAIRMALEERPYCTDIVVAKGKYPTSGRDASLVYHFDTDNSARPKLKEDGTVDFFKLNNLHQCTKGQVLAEIIPEEKGEDGFDVHGMAIPAREVKKIVFSHGRNVEISDDGLRLCSMVDGHVSLVDGTVFVADVYSVDNVGTSTGNIEYHGNVEVKGNVCENFSVKTDGNVFVNGVVEGAVIEAGGDIIIARGMHGQNKGRLKAGGNVIAKFISAAEVEANGFVEAEQIVNAKISAGSNVNADAGKGLITGGRVVAKGVVNAKNIGSAMGAATIIEVGIDSGSKKRLTELQRNVGERSKTISQMKKTMDDTNRKLKMGIKLTPNQLENARMLQVTLAETRDKIQEELKEIERLDKLLKNEGPSHINIRGTMYQGVAVCISGATMTVKNEYTYCRLIKKDADIASTNL
ncbi:MAG: FapA family protein [Lachnospiraceae bacterium]|nr:FapA family protein [Lachnospiraceae bacterium]